ncbi:ribosomal-protein-serine acetyltransferase [Paenibacillus yonginensis]|uniref:Ribosomal-protein-serine acetyltransferase n=1 Tax=Paenibacillus yonginensis TaxID=1462996 RepID=A0A1B1N1I8_9BACL|nr:GNAT family protein [Paenibacillus yonginensis]ANS75276.1 ribosomal-protein-serine acetyltransferase [Paenibacillus yonginensis]
MFKYAIDHSLFISLLETGDAESLFNLIDRNRSHIGEWLKFPNVTLKVEDSRNFIEMVRMRYARNEGYWLGIWLEEKLIGSIGFLFFDFDNKKTEIGYWIDKEYEGHGLISKTIKVLIEYAFKDLGLNKIEIGMAVQNLRSRAIPEKLGFKHEGTIRDYEYINGKYLDRMIYGLKANEWKAK